jgi:hypothetical protein
MKTAILLFALLTTPAWSASYERQSEAVAICQQRDHGDVYDMLRCMEDAGFKFCKHCQQFGTMMGGTCVNQPEGMDRPACWYPRNEPAPTAGIELRRWMHWIKNRGWEKQNALLAA